MKSDTALKNNRNSRLDKLGIAAATICAGHCLLTPFLIGLLPIIGLSQLADERTEWAFVAISLLLGILSILPGYFRYHRRPAPLCVFAIGGLLILSARFLLEDQLRIEILAVVTGAFLLAVGHGINYRLCQTCFTCQPNSSNAS